MTVSSHTFERSLMPPRGRHPYYIVTPAYTRFSGGIKAMHLLCHGLNRIGQNAFVLPYSQVPGDVSPVNPDLLTPSLTAQIVVAHHAAGLTPVVVYPEVVNGNPLQAEVVVRYILNVAGLLGGPSSYSPQDMLFGYGEDLAPPDHPDQNLYLPTVDTSVFHPPETERPRSGTCFYARKFRALGGQLFEQTRDSVEITTEQTPEELAEIFQRSELMYCYENTALSLEATLCGCPVVFLPNQHLAGIIGTKDLKGAPGMSWGDAPENVARAKQTVGGAYENFLATFDVFWQQLDHFVELTQARARATPYSYVLMSPAKG